MQSLTIDPAREVERISEFIRDTMANTGKANAIIAVSGGIDSATSLMLTAKALGPQQIITLHLPTKTTHPVHTKDAQLVIDAANIPTGNQLTINIGSIIQKSWRIINRHSVGASLVPAQIIQATTRDAPTPQTNRLRLANIAARIRMMVLYDQAKKHDAIVIGTENMSEHLLGYYTRFGDEASDIEPIRHLYKTQIIEIAKHLNVPQPIIEKPPSADLWKSQSDEKELGFSYQLADPILFAYAKGQSEADLINTFDKESVSAVLKQVKLSAFKHHVPYHM